MGRYYWGSIEGKFWVAVQPSSDIENLVNCEYQQHYCWDHQRLQKKCTLDCGDTWKDVESDYHDDTWKDVDYDDNSLEIV